MHLYVAGFIREPWASWRMGRAVVGMPVELRLGKSLVRRMAQRKENLHQAAALSRDDVFRYDSTWR